MLKDKLIECLENLEFKNHPFFYSESCRTIIQVLLLIDEKKIGKDSDAKIQNEGTFEVRLISQTLNQINVYISIFEDSVIDIQVDKGGEYLYLQEINSDEDLIKLRETFNDLLRNKIETSYYWINDSLRKIEYNVPYINNSLQLVYRFVTILGAKGLFKKYTVSQKIFEPWIE